LCDTIAFNIHIPTEDKTDGVKDSLYLELECAFDKFPKYHMERFKPTTGNESLNEISINNRVRLVNFATSKNLTVKRTVFLQCNIHKYTWTSPNRKTHPYSDGFGKAFECT
jgi:hypothetical protein